MTNCYFNLEGVIPLALTVTQLQISELLRDCTGDWVFDQAGGECQLRYYFDWNAQGGYFDNEGILNRLVELGYNRVAWRGQYSHCYEDGAPHFDSRLYGTLPQKRTLRLVEIAGQLESLGCELQELLKPQPAG